MTKKGKSQDTNARYFLMFTLAAVIGIGLFLGVAGYADDVVQSVTIDADPPSITSVLVATTSGGYDVSDFNPVEATSTTIYVRGEAVDYNGCSTIDAASNWDIVVFRSGVSGGRNCVLDKNDCYPAIEAGNITLSGCSGLGDIDIDFEIPVSLAFWADPTDYGAPMAAQNWIASVRLTDDDENYTTSVDTFELNSLIALGVPTSLSYGSVRPGQASSAKELVFTQAGNRAFDIEQTSPEPAMVCNGANSNNIPWNSIEMSVSRYFVYGTGVDLAAKQHLSVLDLSMPQRLDDGNATIKKVYFRLQLPASGISGTCTGTTRFTATADS